MFDQLGSVLNQTAQAFDETVWRFTEAMMPVDHATTEQPKRFLLVVSRQFSGLLLAEAVPLCTEPLQYQVELTFVPDAIAAFMATLSSQLQDEPVSVRRLQEAREQLQANDPAVQSEFTLRLTDVLIAPQTQLQTQIQQQESLLEQHAMERLQVQDALLAAQAASRTKTEFLAAMSHELRTPLTCVIGMADTLLRFMTLKPEVHFLQLQKQEGYLKLIKRSGEHLLELINDILDVSQVEAGRAVLNVRSFSLSQIAHQSLQMLQERARSKGVELTLRTLQRDSQSSVSGSNHPEDDAFTADPRRVSQILLNLLTNAIKFTPEGGHVTLRFGNKQNIAMFQVEDTGIGISESQRPLLFQMFQQLDSALNRTYEGTGLGLALTKQLVELHNGRIEVHSTVGVGSTFTVWLPAQPIAQSTKSNSKTLPAITANLLETDAATHPLPVGERIVLIEDHDETAMLICDLLTATDCQVVWMIDGSTAMRQIELLHPCLIIINRHLPDMQSDDILYFVHQHPALQATKILMLVEQNTSGDHLEAGADAYLTKPIEPYPLLDQVAALVGESRKNKRQLAKEQK